VHQIVSALVWPSSASNHRRNSGKVNADSKSRTAKLIYLHILNIFNQSGRLHRYCRVALMFGYWRAPGYGN